MMTRSDLPRIFYLTALVTLALTMFAAVSDFQWAASFAKWALLMNLNWVGLALLISGWLDTNVFRVVLGLQLKLAAYTGIILVSKFAGLEIVPFLLATHIFLLMAFFFVLGKVYFARFLTPKTPMREDALQNG